MRQPPPGFDEMSVEEQIEYVQSLWDRIAETPESVPVPEAHRSVIKQRLAAHRRDAGAAMPWPEARDRIEKKLGGSDGDE